MKKLMIVAALAASTAAFGADCTPDPTPVPPTAEGIVYTVKMSVKTTKGIANQGKDIVDPGTTCTPGGDPTPGACVVYRTKDSTTLQGWIAECTITCGILDGGKAYIYDSKRKAPVMGAAFTTTFLNVMGKKANEAEWAWTFEGNAAYDEVRAQAYALTGAGVGKYDTKKGIYTSFAGNFAGTVAASYDLKASSKIACACEPSQIFKCDQIGDLTDSDTVAYGTWSVKYNASLSKKFAKVGVGALKVPSYAAAILAD